MGESHPLIPDESDYSDFVSRSRRYLRIVEERRPTGTRKALQAHPLVKHMREEVQWTTQRQTGAWCCLVIGVDEGDGMTWSAASAERDVARLAPELPRHTLGPKRGTDGLPQVATLIERPRLIALAQESGLVPPLPALRKRWVFAAALLLVVAGTLAAVVNALVRDRSKDGFDIAFLALGAAVAVLLLVSQEVGTVLKRSSREEARERALKRVREAAAETNGDRETLVRALERELVEHGTDRCVIVDDLDKLDPVTIEVLHACVRNRTRNEQARELWVIFEDAEVGTLSKDLLLPSKGANRGGASVRVILLRQRNLDEDKRAELAAELGLPPERAEFRRVKVLVRRDTDSLRDVELRLDQVADMREGDARAYGPLELLHILAVDSTTGLVDFPADGLVSDLSSKRSAHTREVLQLVLPGGTLERNEVTHAIDRLKRLEGGMLDATRLENDRLEPVRDAAEAIRNRRAAYGLADEGLVHLFWAFYWFAKLGGRDASKLDGYYLRKLGRHLLTATPPSAFAGKLSPAASRQYVKAAAWTGRQLLRASLPDGLPRLLRLAEAEPGTSGERAQLRRLCWQAFAVLGDESVLATLVRLHPGTAPKQAVTELERLFLDSTSFRDDAEASRAGLSERLRSLDADIVGFARARALWLGLTLQSALPHDWTAFSALAAGGCETAEQIVRDALRRFLDTKAQRTACDALAISLGIWCYALAYRLHRGDLAAANALIEDVRLKALVPGQVDEDDFVLRGLLHEIETMAGAAAAVILSAHGDADDLEADELEELERLAKHVDEVAETPKHAEKEIAVRLSMLALTWIQLGYGEQSPVGFEQLVAFTTLRRAHFKLLCGSEEATETVMRNTLEGMSSQLQTTGAIGLLAHAIGEISAGDYSEMGAVVLTRGVDAALASGVFGTRLETELSLMAVAEAHSTRFSLQRPLRHLLTVDAESRPHTRLRARLEEFGPTDRASASLWCLNVVKRDFPDSVVEQMAAEVAALSETTEEPARAEMLERLHLFGVDRDIKAGRLDLDRALRFWDGGEQTPGYAFMLYRFTHTPDWEQTVLPRALAWFRDHPEVPSETGPIFLAEEVIPWVPASDPQQREILEYLDRAHRVISGELSAETNQEILKLFLVHEVGDPQERRAELTHWAVIRQQRDGLEKLPNLVSEGRFFLVVWHYYETLAVFGLVTEPETDYADLVWMSDARREELLFEWQANDSPVPAVIAESGRITRQLSGDFLRFGRMLFLTGDPGFEDARDAFDVEAENALGDVYNLLIGVRGMPEPLRHLLNQHRQRLLRPATRPSRT